MLAAQDVAIGRTGVNTYCQFAFPTFRFVHCNVDLPVDFEFVQGQFIFDFHRDSFAL